MKLNTNPMTAQIPSGFGMPACGHASVTSSAVFGTTTVAVRERQIAAVAQSDVKCDMGLAGYTPGTSAWSPPSS
jgi:hypothetical protein